MSVEGGGGVSSSDLPSGAAGEAADLSLEERLERLGRIVEALERNDVELDRALALFEEGIRLVRDAERALDAAELRVQELVGEEGATELKPHEGGSS